MDSTPAAGVELIPGYRELTEIGAGRYGVTYRAHDQQSDRTVALNVLSPQFANARLRRQFLREAQYARELPAHPNVVAVLDSGVTASGQPYVTAEYFPSGSLVDHLAARGPLPVDDVVRVAEAVCAALRGPHEDGRAHGDIRPQNIFLRKKEVPALAGFDTGRLPAPDSCTGGGPYTAPEVLSGTAPSPQSDLFSLGATLYHLLTGRPADEPAGQLPPITRADVPAHVYDAIQRAMATDVAQRFPDLPAFAEALRPPEPVPVAEAAIAEAALAEALAESALAEALRPPPQQPLAEPPFIPPSMWVATAPTPPMSAAQPESRPAPPASVDAVPWPDASEEEADEIDAARAAAAPAARNPGLASVGPEDDGPGVPPPSRRRGPVTVALASVALVVLAMLALLATRHHQTDQPLSGGNATAASTPASTPAFAPTNRSAPATVPTGGSAAPSQRIDLAAAAPTKVTAVDGGTAVSLHWVLAAGTQNRNVIVQQSPTDPGRPPVTFLDPGALSYTATGLNAATGYCFRVGIFFAAGSNAAPAVVAWSAPSCIRGAVPSSS